MKSNKNELEGIIIFNPSFWSTSTDFRVIKVTKKFLYIGKSSVVNKIFWPFDVSKEIKVAEEKLSKKSLRIEIPLASISSIRKKFSWTYFGTIIVINYFLSKKKQVLVVGGANKFSFGSDSPLNKNKTQQLYVFLKKNMKK